MSNPNGSIAAKVKAVKFDYDRTKPSQVYAALRFFYPTLAARYFTPQLIAPFIPADAEPKVWLKNLRNVEYNQLNPLARPRRRSNDGKARKGHNYAADVVSRDRVPS